MKVSYQHICFNPHTTKHHFLKILAKKTSLNINNKATGKKNQIII
jgi:hypothetical protein